MTNERLWQIGRSGMWNKWIFRFEELAHECNDFNDKKYAKLGEMARGRLPVPSGFAV
jgi:hypothetical protein